MKKLQTLWIDHKGRLTAKKRDGYSMPLYSATDVDVAMRAERRRVVQIVASLQGTDAHEWAGRQVAMLTGPGKGEWIRRATLLKILKGQP